MPGGNHRAAHARAFQSQFVQQPARRDRAGIFEDATRARRRRLRSPALLAERLHALLDFRARQSPASENRAQRGVIFSVAQLRYSTDISFGDISETLPSKSITRTDSTASNVAP